MKTKHESCPVLVVDDDDSLRSMIVELLHLEGYKTIEAPNGKVALDIVSGESDKPCIVLLDLKMPIMNGMEFLKAVRESGQLSFLKVFVISANADQTNTEGSIGFTKKPVDLEEILKVVSHHCPS